jgi:MOSC domain-containing protein YiiM
MVMVDGERYGRQDALGTLAALAPWWEQLAHGRTPPPVFTELVRAQVDVMANALGEPTPEPSVAALWDLGPRLTAQVRATKVGEEVVLPPSLRLLRRASEALRAAGELPARTTGEVVRVNSSAGGVPKLAVPSARIDRGGLVGDRQRTRVHHGRAWQALCVWSAEVVDALAAEGHPIAYGSAGENVTVRGIPWERVQAGVQLRLGTALAECTLFALPCKTNAPWFLGGDFARMHHERGPWSRIYARVLEPGEVRPGDVAILEPFSDPTGSGEPYRSVQPDRTGPARRAGRRVSGGAGGGAGRA